LYDRSGSQCLFDPAKALMTLISKNKGGILGEKLSYRFSYLREILDEAAIKARMTKETLESLY